MMDFLAMGGHAGFIWPAYLITAAAMLAIWLVSRHHLVRSQAALERLEREIENRRNTSGQAS